MKKLLIFALSLASIADVASSSAAVAVSVAVGDQGYYTRGPVYVVGGVRHVWVGGHYVRRHGHRIWVHGNYVVR